MFSVLILTALMLIAAPSIQSAPVARLYDIQGAIGPAVAEDIEHAIADAQGQSLFILRMDTPGGLDLAMRRIIQAILASAVPVIAYVAPQGARAASAGTYILYASHIAAMASATNLGAATPVQIGGMPRPDRPKPEMPASPNATRKSPAPESTDNPMQHKMINDAAAYIRSLAQLRGRNAEWAEQAVRNAASLSADQALKQNVIDVIADDIPQLLSRLDGRTVVTSLGKITLKTQSMVIETVERSWRSRLLAVISDPNVAYILMLLGMYGLFFELANPGFVLPGVIGGISLLLALFAFQVLPVNIAGLGLIVLGIAFMVAEAFIPSFGALGLGGVIAFVAGSIMLMDTGVPGYGVSMLLIGSVAFVSALFFILITGMAIRARMRPVVSGAEELLHESGIALESFEQHGRVQVHGETWQASSDYAVRQGAPIQVTGRDGLMLKITPLPHKTTEVRS
ncbi:MAG: nodulation protein NfeD [Mariprofundus sp.]|nr:nodulation protein NfeD [Mariprofundus sp.]